MNIDERGFNGLPLVRKLVLFGIGVKVVLVEINHRIFMMVNAVYNCTS